MPELPEVEAVCRRLQDQALGARILQAGIQRHAITRPQPASWVAQEAAGRRIAHIERRGKHILVGLSGQRTLHIHLGMTGNLYVTADVRLRPAETRAWFAFEDGRGLIFEDQRALGRLHLLDPGELERNVLEHLGVEPLSPEFTAAWLAEKAARARQPAKLFLMDQRIVAGLGNIYAAEALFRARIHPGKPLSRVRRQRLERLHAAIVSLLEQAIASAVAAYGAPGRFTEAESFACQVYGRQGEPCFRCGRRIQRILQGGRSTYFCPGCQR